MRLTKQAHELCRGALSPGDAAIDATAGNGHDTLFLARAVGPSGTVFAFDVQSDAIAATSQRLTDEGLTNVTLLQRDHAEMDAAVPSEFHGQVAAVMFNLGYLSGGDHGIVTRPSTTLAAVQQSLALLRRGGVLTVLAYTGHAGGREEADLVQRRLAGLNRDEWDVATFTSDGTRSPAPQLFVVTRR